MGGCAPSAQRGQPARAVAEIRTEAGGFGLDGPGITFDIERDELTFASCTNPVALRSEVELAAASRKPRTQRSKTLQGSSRDASALPAMPRTCAASASASTASSAPENAA